MFLDLKALSLVLTLASAMTVNGGSRVLRSEVTTDVIYTFIALPQTPASSISVSVCSPSLIDTQVKPRIRNCH
jgi:hypothetical protein